MVVPGRPFIYYQCSPPHTFTLMCDIYHKCKKKKMIGTNLCLEASEKVGIEFPH